MIAKPVTRSYQGEEDFWRIREFLREVFMLNERRLLSWHVARLDYARWHVYLNVDKVRPEDVITLWELEGQLVAVLLPDGGFGEAHFLVHPRHRNMALEEEMLAVAEERLADRGPDGTRELVVWTPEQYRQRRAFLEEQGYRPGKWIEHQWQRDLEEGIAEAAIPAGYDIRALGTGLELLERCYASGLAFHQGDIKTGVENRDDPTWYQNIQSAPLYRRDLDLVAIGPSGAIAAFSTVWFDDVTRSAYFEPVGTVPAHQRKGLGRALLTEGLRRLQRMGATRAFVCGYSEQANALYRGVMGSEPELYEMWLKRW